MDYEKDDFPTIIHSPRDLEGISLDRNIGDSVLLDVISMVISYHPPFSVQAKSTKRLDFRIEDTKAHKAAAVRGVIILIPFGCS
ncbi:hypothetical protein CASFOL_042732 [Castilleja foliolosa]|uniref:Uncharacterized protein n=1 Tax=Castilleja foliolosa TaxID=1961234 RepID=A0ABD3B862_9LAMI